MYTVPYLRERGRRCRELSKRVQNESLRQQLLDLAKDFEAEADRLHAIEGGGGATEDNDGEAS